MMIQHNISAPCTLLDFPTRDVFEQKLAEGHYDIVGISSIIPNVGKVPQAVRERLNWAPAPQHDRSSVGLANQLLQRGA